MAHSLPTSTLQLISKWLEIMLENLEFYFGKVNLGECSLSLKMGEFLEGDFN